MDFFHIVQQENIEMLRNILNDVNIDQRDHYGNTALILVEDYEKTLLLLDHGADVNAQNNWGLTALSASVQGPDKGLPIVLLLLNYCANVHLSNPMVFAESQYVPILLASGADVNAQNAGGQTRLMVTAYSFDVATAQILLDHGAGPNFKNMYGQTVLTIAQVVGKRVVGDFSKHVDIFIALLQQYGATA